MSANFGRRIRVMIVDFLSVSIRVTNVEVAFGCVREGISREPACPKKRHQRSVDVNLSAD